MKCVDMKLNPSPEPPDWKDFEGAEFVCSQCLETLPSRIDGLLFFREVDFFFHRHADRFLYRALLLTDDGGVRLAVGDSESENVLQLLGIHLDGLGEYKLRYKTLAELRSGAKRFFQAMRMQNRKVAKSTFHMGSDGTLHFG